MAAGGGGTKWRRGGTPGSVCVWGGMADKALCEGGGGESGVAPRGGAVQEVGACLVSEESGTRKGRNDCSNIHSAISRAVLMVIIF